MALGVMRRSLSLLAGLSSHGTAVASVIIASPEVWDEHGKRFSGYCLGSRLEDVFCRGDS